MSNCEIERIIPAIAASEGAGVTVHRTIGTRLLRNYDPFLMLDHFGSDDPNEYIAGFPDHPHRGFTTLTYMLDGHMEHRDSMGNRGDLKAGGAQWMKAASGIIHSEMPKQSAGLMRGFQLWINLPATQKMSDPAYQEYNPSAIPIVDLGDARVRVLAGRIGEIEGPIVDNEAKLLYLDAELRAGGTFRLPLAKELRGFVYVYQGAEIAIENNSISTHQLVALKNGDELAIKNGTEPAKLIIVFGKPFGEPIVQYGPFVMNTQEEIEQALRDYRSGQLVQKKAAFTTR